MGHKQINYKKSTCVPVIVLTVVYFILHPTV